MTIHFIGIQGMDILKYILGIIAFVLFFVVCFFIGQVGVQLRSGFAILAYIRKAESEARTKGMVLNKKGIALRKKGYLKTGLTLTGIIVFYALAFLLIPVHNLKYASLLLLVPVVLGYFGLFFVPEQLSDD